jgi:DNA-directed RNA polymerase subunit RPC12/RpoP
MRVRCSFCGAEYDAAVSLAALELVDRCERCGRARLHAADPDGAEQVSTSDARGDGRPRHGRVARLPTSRRRQR